MHSQTSQFQFHAKINLQKYTNAIPSNFESMITHQVPISWILNKSNHALSSRVHFPAPQEPQIMHGWYQSKH